MADQTSELQIVIEAINKASATLKQVEKDLGGLSNSVGEQGAVAQSSAVSFNQLIGAVAGGTIIANIAISAWRKLADAIARIPKLIFDFAHYASEVEGFGIAMHIVANNAGITAAEVDKVRDSVMEQNVTMEASNRLLTDLIRNQLDYTQATKLAAAAQDIAVASGFDSSETVERISQAISSGNTYLLQQLGLHEHLNIVYKRYAETLGKTSEELTEQQRKQAVVNYVLQEGEKYAGAYSSAMENSAKVMRSIVGRQFLEVKRIIGEELTDGLDYATLEFYKAVQAILVWAKENEGKLKAIARAVGNFVKSVVDSIKNFIASIPWDRVINALNFVIRQVAYFASGIKIAANAQQIFIRATIANLNTLKSLAMVMWKFVTRDFEGVKNVYVDWKNYSLETVDAITKDLGDIGNAFKMSYNAQAFDLREWWQNVEEIEGSGWEDRLKKQREGLEQLTREQKDTLKKLLEDWEKENINYARAVEKRVKQFEESFDDLVMSHRDNIKRLTEDLSKESRDYNRKLQDLLADYNEAMDDIELRHKEKTESIMENMEDERKKAEEEIKKITKAYNEEVSIIEKEGEDRLSNLKSQLDKEKALGTNANKEKIEALEQMISYEKSGLASSLDDKKAKYDEEVSDVNEKLNDKLEKIKAGLAKEDAAYADSFAKRKIQYEEDTADAKASYEEKRQALQKELDTELAIREKYAEDFKIIGDRVAEDDLTRMVRKHNEELAEMSRDHNEKLAEIENKAFEQGEAFAKEFARGIGSGYPQVQSRLDQMSNDLDRAIGKVDTFSSKVGQLGDFYTPQNYPMGNYPYYGQAGGVFSKPTIVGEAGAEVVLPLNFPKRMAMIMKAMGMGGQGGGQVTQNFYVNVSGSQDIDVLMERAGFAMKNQGGLT
jgi:hypothetical protein